jgi:3'(2'), 5'-bisphosphate nucleotidase
LLVDPLDGTKEFIARTDEFSVNIALIENNEVILGVVYSPVTGIAHAARRGGGAFRLENGEKQKLRASAFPAGREAVFRIAASRRHRGKNDQAFYEIISCDMGPVELTLAGSAFKICAVAAGEADVYPRFGTTMEWDTAAGQIIVEEAGGALLDDKGRPLRYNQRQTMKNGNFLVTGREPEKWLAAWQASQAM